MIEKVTDKILEIINTTDISTKMLRSFVCYVSEDYNIEINFNFDDRGNLFFYLSLINNIREIVDQEKVFVLKRENIKEKVELLYFRNKLSF